MPAISRGELQVGVGHYTVASLQTVSKRKRPALAEQAQCIASAMMAAIKPNVVSQHRVPISKSALLLILYQLILVGELAICMKPLIW